MEIRFASHPEDVKHFTTERLRSEFLIEKLMEPGQLKFVYSHYDRFIVGGAVPTTQAIALPTYEKLKADYFLERREMGIINVGQPGTVTVDGQTYTLQNKECLFIGKGIREVIFASASAENPAHYYICSAPAHTSYPTTHYTLQQAAPVEMGTVETANQRTIYKFIHAEGIKSCQLVMGMTLLKTGSVWNTMPCHVHDRRMEAYFYFDMPENQRMFHMMGEPNQIRPLIVANEEAILSPPWSIHCGAGTTNYSFIWAMAGENFNYTDMDFVHMHELR